MRNQIRIWMVIMGVIIALGVSGCSTPQTVAYRSLATIAASVDASVHVYADLYAAGKSSNEEREKIKAAYEVYQAAMVTAQRVQQAAISAPDGQSNYTTAVQIVSASAQSVIDLINQITKGK